MATFSLNPTYYQVTFTLPAGYAALTGNQSGGLDPTSSWDINRTISVTGATAVTSTVMAEAETFLVNNFVISCVAADTLATIITKVNNATSFTGVIADQSVAGTYITLKNAPGYEGTPFSLAEGNAAALSKLGLTAGVYRYFPSEVGTAFSSVTTGSNVTINGTNVIFTAGALPSTAAQLNASTATTGVVAYPAGPYLQLASVSGQPWAINSGNALSTLGTTAGSHGGFPSTLSNSLSKERANIRWQQAVNELSEFSNPTIGNIIRTGNVANVSASTITFTVGYDRPDQVATIARPAEPDAGNVLVGAVAVKRAVARALTSSIASNRKIFDPTIEAVGSSAIYPNAAQIQNITASALDIVANIVIVESNLAVTQIASV